VPVVQAVERADVQVSTPGCSAPQRAHWVEQPRKARGRAAAGHRLPARRLLKARRVLVCADWDPQSVARHLGGRERGQDPLGTGLLQGLPRPFRSADSEDFVSLGGVPLIAVFDIAVRSQLSCQFSHQTCQPTEWARASHWNCQCREMIRGAASMSDHAKAQTLRVAERRKLSQPVKQDLLDRAAPIAASRWRQLRPGESTDWPVRSHPQELTDQSGGP
jgi:hypothetical protein